MSLHDLQTLTQVLLLLDLKLRGGIKTYNQETQDVRVEGGEGGMGEGLTGWLRMGEGRDKEMRWQAVPQEPELPQCKQRYTSATLGATHLSPTKFSLTKLSPTKHSPTS